MVEVIRVGVVGSAGYAGGELLRLLLLHPKVKLVFAHSNSQVGKPLYSVHTDLFGDTDLHFTDRLSQDIDVLFLCLAHGDSRIFLERNVFSDDLKIIDLSQDFRLKDSAGEFVYGLPELNREAIRKAKYVANPGCFATAIQLALLPLASIDSLDFPLHINAITGATGAGQQLSGTSHFSWRNNNVSTYKVFEHQHLNEIGESLGQLHKGYKPQMKMIPIRGDFSRGIFATLLFQSDLGLSKLESIYEGFYREHPFTHFSPMAVDLKQVVNTNKCLINIQKVNQDVIITVAIDNLLKGASGQAIQNMNLLFGLEEKTGLQLKASAF